LQIDYVTATRFLNANGKHLVIFSRSPGKPKVMSRLINPLRFFFKFILPICLLVVIVFKIVTAPKIGWLPFLPLDYLDIAYKIILSSMVGYFTNFLAITMLFKPKNRSKHGIQGLIPGNQDEIAERLGDGISENFFNSTDLIDYIQRNDLIASSISGISTYVEERLENPQYQRSITNWILMTFQSNSPRLFYLLQQVSDVNLSQYLHDKVDLGKLIKELVQLIEKNIEDGTIDLTKISKELTNFIHNHIPEISKVIYDQLNKIIEKQGALKRNILKVATWTFDVDEEMIEENLTDLVSSPDFRHRIYKYLEEGVNRFTEYLSSEKGNREINRYYRKAVIELLDKFRLKGVPFLLTEIDEFLQKESSWRKIENNIKRGLNFAKETLEKTIASEKFDSFLDKSMPTILERIKISSIVTEKVKAYDTTNLEKMIRDASGEHLGAIEVLGGVLGGFVGIALFNPLLFLYILSGIFILGGVEYLLTKRQQSKQG